MRFTVIGFNFSCSASGPAPVLYYEESFPQRMRRKIKNWPPLLLLAASVENETGRESAFVLKRRQDLALAREERHIINWGKPDIGQTAQLGAYCLE